MAYRILVASLVVCLLVVTGLLVLERTGLIEIDEKAIQPEVVSCQIGHKDMEVRVQGSRASYRGEVVPRYEFCLPSLSHPRQAGASFEERGRHPKGIFSTLRRAPGP